MFIAKLYVCEIHTPLMVSTSSSLCGGDSILLSIDSTYSSYLWSTSDTLANIYVSNPGNYNVTVVNGSGCIATSQNIHIKLTTPPIPVISEVNPFQLQSTPGFSYQWYFNNNPIANSDSITITISHTGTYTVQVIDSNGCSSLSNPFNVTSVAIPELSDKQLKLTQSGNHIFIKAKNVIQSLSLINMLGETLSTITPNNNEFELNVSSLTSGIYILNVQFSGNNQHIKFYRN